MEKKKYLKSYWNNIPALLTIVLLSSCMNPQTMYEDQELSTSIHSPFVAMKVEYEKQIYCAVLEEAELFIFPSSAIGKGKYRKDIFPILRQDTITIDYTTYKEICKRNGLFIPVHSIDSIYNGNANNLLSAYFDKCGNLLSGKLSDIEEKYIIYLLFQHSIYLMTDCETGYKYIINY